MAEQKICKMRVEFEGAETTDGEGIAGAGHVTIKAGSTAQLLSMAEAIVLNLAGGVFKHLGQVLPEDGGEAASMASAILILKAVDNGLDTFFKEEGLNLEKIRNYSWLLEKVKTEEMDEGVQNGKVS